MLPAEVNAWPFHEGVLRDNVCQLLRSNDYRLDGQPELLCDQIPDLCRQEIIIGSMVVYVHCPEGYGRTKYHNNFIEKKLSANATSRNWNTCQKLLEISSE